MKKIYYLLAVIGLSAYGCSDMNDIHQKYLDRGETVYTGAPDSLKAFGGNNRVKLKWEIDADPRIQDMVIRWNNRNDSTIIKVDRSDAQHIGIYQDSTLLNNNLTEGSELFQFYTRDGKGHQSVIKEITAEIYGANFASAASYKSPRKITGIGTVDFTTVKVAFATVEDATIQYTKVTYTCYTNNPNGERKTVRVENNQSEVILEGVKLGEKVEYQSCFLPDKNALDSFDGKVYTYSMPDMILPQTGDWETLEGSGQDYGGWQQATVGYGRFLEKATGSAAIGDGTNCYSTNLAMESKANWRIGLKINSDYSIQVYMAKLNPDWVSAFKYCKYIPEECYFDPKTGYIHFNYDVLVEGAWEIKGVVHMKYVPAS